MMRLGTIYSVAIPVALLMTLSRPVAGKEGYVERKPLNLAPVKTTEAVSVHSPFGTGDCSLCHKSKDPKKPGPAIKPVNDVCYFCHEDVQKVMTGGKYKHAVAEKDCTTCHNPHNSKFRQLLLAPVTQLCNDCHVGIRKRMDSKVKHGALATDKSCSACHSPHASDVEKILLRLPYDQCIGCHGTDDLKDSQGKLLTNYRKLLAENPIHHAPVAQKDCSSCHEPHGSDHTRLAIAEYPPQFYAPFAPANYALCFTCHDEKMVTAKETLTDTRFRDGAKNLHFAHVNKADKGRICRACHEVHASKQPYLIRESVPFGPKGWLLRVEYKKNPDGGTCDKTCHTARSYVNAVKK